MKRNFKKRARSRMSIAYILLSIALLTIFIGIILMIKQLDDLSDETTHVELSIVARLSFLVLILFIVQVLLKLYRYNILKADYYLSSYDALSILEEMDDDQITKYQALFATLISDKTTLTESETPSIQNLKKKLIG